jgi:hypothetical protein
MEDIDPMEVHTSMNFLHSHFPRCQTDSEPLASEVPPSNFVKKIEIKNCPRCGLLN